MRFRFSTAVVLASSLALAGVAVAQKKKGKGAGRPAPACGIDYLPLAEGNSWTYEPINPPPGFAPANLVVTVTKVETADGTTTITMEEKYRDYTSTMTATCDKSGLVVPADSFFFASEPGGALLMTLENAVHKGTSYPAKKLDGQWFEEVKADVLRAAAPDSKAVHDPAKIEFERLTTVGGKERVTTGMGVYSTTRLEFEVRGRSIIGEKQQEIPVREKGALWFAPRIGVVKTQEISGRQWQLIDTNLLEK